MEKMETIEGKKTYIEMYNFATMTNIFLSNENHVETKLGKALSNVNKEYAQPAIEGYQKEVESIMFKHSFTDKDGVIEYENLFNKEGALIDRRYKYTKETQLKRDEDLRELFEEWKVKEFSVIPQIVLDHKIELSSRQKEVFSGFVI